ncbi:MAG: signal transduction histidine kinase [Rickettsiales bacterium]|jgi:signal transduction histidine kinase
MYKNQHLPNISHDLRNYIQGIHGLSQLISKNISSYQKLQNTKSNNSKAFNDSDGSNLPSKNSSKNNFLKEAEELAYMLEPYSNEALEYIEDMLDATQAETGKFTIGRVEDCNIEKLIPRLLIFNKTFLIEHKALVKTEISPNLPLLKCDLRRLKQILTNLITNSAKYSSENSAITIRAFIQKSEINQDLKTSHNSETRPEPANTEKKADANNLTATKSSSALIHNCHHQGGLEFQDKLMISIEDSGIGMNEAEINLALAGNGTQIDKSSLHKKDDSHGLGMPIIKQLVELLNGEMKIESEKGSGTKVSLSFAVN